MRTLLVAVSWYFTRRLTRPLEELRARMQSHRPGEPSRTAAPIDGASPEVAAIETAYDELLQRFERHERERALLLAGVSHDLRSPLARIRMAAGLLPEEPASAKWREAIVRNTQVADRLIESFLDHVRAGELSLDQGADLAALARSAAAAARPWRRRTAGATRPTTLPLQRSHPLLVERLVANLLDNAFKHGRAPVRLSARAEGDQAVLEVSDAGAGVPEAQREALHAGLRARRRGARHAGRRAGPGDRLARRARAWAARWPSSGRRAATSCASRCRATPERGKRGHPPPSPAPGDRAPADAGPIIPAQQPETPPNTHFPAESAAWPR